MKPKTRAFHKLVHEVTVPPSLVKICEARGADYVGDQGFGVYVARVIVAEAPVLIRINDLGEQLVEHPIAKTIQRPVALSAWPVAQVGERLSA